MERAPLVFSVPTLILSTCMLLVATLCYISISFLVRRELLLHATEVISEVGFYDPSQRFEGKDGEGLIFQRAVCFFAIAPPNYYDNEYGKNAIAALFSRMLPCRLIKLLTTNTSYRVCTVSAGGRLAKPKSVSQYP